MSLETKGSDSQISESCLMKEDSSAVPNDDTLQKGESSGKDQMQLSNDVGKAVEIDKESLHSLKLTENVHSKIGDDTDIQLPDASKCSNLRLKCDEFDDCSNNSIDKFDDNLINRLLESDDETCGAATGQDKKINDNETCTVATGPDKHLNNVETCLINRDHDQKASTSIDCTVSNFQELSQDVEQNSSITLDSNKLAYNTEMFTDAENTTLHGNEENFDVPASAENEHCDSIYESCHENEILESPSDSVSTIVLDSAENSSKDSDRTFDKTTTQSTSENLVDTETTTEDASGEDSAVTESTTEILSLTQSFSNNSLITQSTSEKVCPPTQSSSNSGITVEPVASTSKDCWDESQNVINNMDDTEVQDNDNTSDDKMELKWEDDDDEMDESTAGSFSTKFKINHTLKHELSKNFDYIANKNKSLSNSFKPLTKHSLNKPDIMLEIPIEDLIDFSDEEDGVNYNDEVDDDDCVSDVCDDSNDMNKTDSCILDNHSKIKNSVSDEIVSLNELPDGPAIADNIIKLEFKSEKDSDEDIPYENREDLAYNCDNQSLCSIICEETSVNESKDSLKKHFNIETKMSDETVIGSLQSMDSTEKKMLDKTSNEANMSQPSISGLHQHESVVLENMSSDSNLVEMSDSLGLLAESSRVMDDDEEGEEEDDGDDEDDTEPEDDQMAGEHSDDSNPQPSESGFKDVKDDSPSISDKETSSDGMSFTISGVRTDILSTIEKEVLGDGTHVTNSGENNDNSIVNDRQVSGDGLSIDDVDKVKCEAGMAFTISNVTTGTHSNNKTSTDSLKEQTQSEDDNTDDTRINTDIIQEEAHECDMSIGHSEDDGEREGRDNVNYSIKVGAVDGSDGLDEVRASSDVEEVEERDDQENDYESNNVVAVEESDGLEEVRDSNDVEIGERDDQENDNESNNVVAVEESFGLDEVRDSNIVEIGECVDQENDNESNNVVAVEESYGLEEVRDSNDVEIGERDDQENDNESNNVVALEESDGLDEVKDSNDVEIGERDDQENDNESNNVVAVEESDGLVEVTCSSDVEESQIDDGQEDEILKVSDSSDTDVEAKNNTGASAIQSASCEGIREDEKKTCENITLLEYIDLGSSDEDETTTKQDEREIELLATNVELKESGTTVTMPAEIDVISSSAGQSSDIVTMESEIVISGLPKPPPLKPARLNTSEVSIKTTNAKESPLVVHEASLKIMSKTMDIYELDSDEEESTAVEEIKQTTKDEKPVKCVNNACAGDASTTYTLADHRVVAFYDGDRRRRAYVCDACSDAYAHRSLALIQGIRDLTPLLDMEIGKRHEDLVEISDSESEGESSHDNDEKELIGVEAAKFLEDNLADMFNDVWTKYNMDSRMSDAEDSIKEKLNHLRKETAEIMKMFDDCQVATDKLRNDTYSTFQPQIREEPAIKIYDVNDSLVISRENEGSAPETRTAKRRTPPVQEPPAKRPAIPMGYTPLNPSTANVTETTPADKVDDDSTEISVVKLSAEVAPPDLPPPGEITRPPIKVGMSVYAMKNACGSWVKAKVLEVTPRSSTNIFSVCRVKFEHKSTSPFITLPGRHLAYTQPADVRMPIGTRVIALFNDPSNPLVRETYYSGVVAEAPNPVNKYRYLIFFDDGYAQYAPHSQTRLVCECCVLVWEEVHSNSREFVRQYLLAYPERPMVRLHKGQNLKTEWSGKWWSSRVEDVDASLVKVWFVGCDRREWIYRGSTRLAPLFLELQAAERTRPRALPRAQHATKGNAPYVEYIRSDEPPKPPPQPEAPPQNTDDVRRQRAMAKKSTASAQPPLPPPAATGNLDHVTSRVVFYTPKHTVKPHKMVPHSCGPKCKRKDVLELKDLRTYNPLAKPLLSGWERQVTRWRGHKDVMYVAPCGRRLRNMRELHRYLRLTASDLPVDLFDFTPSTHCLAEFVLNKCIVAKKDLSHGKENVPVPCVNYYDNMLPEFCSYNTERTPTAGVPLNLDPEFLCGCDCEDDCEDKSKCSCWKMTLEGARTIGLKGDVGYVYKRLPQPLPSGIYECNSRCKCKHTCLNRVAQHPLQLKLQVFKTVDRGWGIRALNDVPEGAFLCVYAGNLLTDATANLDGLNEGDEYLAELDYIEVVEQMKEGFEEDIPDHIKKLDKKELNSREDTEDEEAPSSEEEEERGEMDDDFEPGKIGAGVMDFDKRLRKRNKSHAQKIPKEEDVQKDCITISDEEEVREPSCFTAAPGMGGTEFISKYRSVRSLFGADEACYIMDAKVQGNIGRYLNHSCSPNVFVQNVFVDTHDPRFPWVAFFAMSHIKAGTELTWNYNYDVGSVPGKALYCYCGAPNCRGRLL